MLDATSMSSAAHVYKRLVPQPVRSAAASTVPVRVRRKVKRGLARTLNRREARLHQRALRRVRKAEVGHSERRTKAPDGRVGHVHAGLTIDHARRLDHDVPAPLVTSPGKGVFAGPRPRFSGKVQPGVTKVVLMERGVLIGATGVNDNGEWAFTHAHSWRPGTHTVEVIALFGASESLPTPRTFKVVGIPEGSPIRASGVSRDVCGDVCEHRPFTGNW